jgi:F-type H+-transporting ATPase subunit delta
MKHKLSSKRLADVLFESAKSNDSLSSARDSITEFDRILRINNDLKSFVQSKRFSQTEKQTILIDSLGGSFNGLVLGVVSYVDGMLAHRTINQIKKLFIEKYKHAKNIVSVHATFSDQISDSDLKFMEKKIGNLLKKETELTTEVDESLVGGAKFRIENTFLDATIKSQLKNIKSDLMKV